MDGAPFFAGRTGGCSSQAETAEISRWEPLAKSAPLPRDDGDCFVRSLAVFQEQSDHEGIIAIIYGPDPWLETWSV
jgi:hypothetical protein